MSVGLFILRPADGTGARSEGRRIRAWASITPARAIVRPTARVPNCSAKLAIASAEHRENLPVDREIFRLARSTKFAIRRFSEASADGLRCALTRRNDSH